MIDVVVEGNVEGQTAVGPLRIEGVHEGIDFGLNGRIGAATRLAKMSLGGPGQISQNKIRPSPLLILGPNRHFGNMPWVSQILTQKQT